MNREIKFRVFDGSDYMSSPFTMRDIFEGKIQFTQDCPLMQFTGLKDKNGTEIYEGDILKRSKEANPNYVAVIEYANGTFGGATYPDRNYWIEMRRLDKCDYDGRGYDEIIGNIYENPSLLNQ